MANKSVGFAEALTHMQKGRKVDHLDWDDREIKHMHIDDNGLGNGGEFIRTDTQKRPTRYVLTTSEILSKDWILL